MDFRTWFSLNYIPLKLTLTQLPALRLLLPRTLPSRVKATSFQCPNNKQQHISVLNARRCEAGLCLVPIEIKWVLFSKVFTQNQFIFNCDAMNALLPAIPVNSSPSSANKSVSQHIELSHSDQHPMIELELYTTGGVQLTIQLTKGVAVSNWRIESQSGWKWKMIIYD